MLCGVIGGTDWLMTAMTLISHNFLKLCRESLIILLPFYILAVAGAVIAVKAMKEEKQAPVRALRQYADNPQKYFTEEPLC